MKPYKYSLFFLLLMFSACKHKELTRVDKGNIVESTVNRKIPQVPSFQGRQLLDKLSSSQSVDNRDLFNYHIIGGSSKRKDVALALSQQLYQKGYPCRVLESNGRYRVVIQSFSNKEVAIRELERLREINHKSDLWLFYDGD